MDPIDQIPASAPCWLSVHKWIGLALAILIIPISLSGAALVWDDGGQ